MIAGMTGQSGVVEAHEGHAVRASHAKSTACAAGTLEVPGLPPELAQGLCARPGSYPVAVRFAQGPGETLGHRVSTHRGMSVKVFGLEGERIAENDEATQDFILATGSTFPAGTARGFLAEGTVISGPAALPEGAKNAVSALARSLNKVLRAVGTESPRAAFFGHPFSHPFIDTYFSQAPVRWGSHMAKVGAARPRPLRRPCATGA